MTILECEQGGAEWQAARLGIPTASCFGRIVTPAGKLSASRDDYLAELLAEWALGEPIEDFDSEWIIRGKLLEPQARAYYAFHADAPVQTVGLCARTVGELVGISDPNLGTAELAIGASPDGLVGDKRRPDGTLDPCGDGGLELKCPSPAKHLLYLARNAVPRKYIAQVQGCLWVTGRAWWDWMSYHPDLPPVVIRCAPDPRFQAALDDALPVFHAELMAGRASLIEKGVEPADPRPQVPDMRKHGMTIADVPL